MRALRPLTLCAVVSLSTGCHTAPTHVLGVRSPQPLVGERVAVDCRATSPEAVHCRVEQSWHAGRDVEALPPQPPSKHLRGTPIEARHAAAELELQARPSWIRAAPIWRHPLTSDAFGLRTCAFREGCTFDFAVLTTSPNVPASVRYDGIRGGAREGVPLTPGEPAHQGQWHGLRGAERTHAPGGPFVGAGFVGRDGLRPRTTVGWAFYAPDWVEHSLALELEPGRVQMVPTVSLVSPGLIALPSVGLGVGVPFRLQPTVAAGARLQASLGFPYVLITGALDLFPGDEAWAQPSLILALSL